MSVDVAEGAAVAFDSYETEDGSRKSEYGKYVIQDGKEVGHQHIIRYNDGITSVSWKAESLRLITTGSFSLGFSSSIVTPSQVPLIQMGTFNLSLLYLSRSIKTSYSSSQETGDGLL
jgi:hypothetical protein